jgi:hypothetical protein
MKDISKLTTIHIVWDGPFSLTELNDVDDRRDYGIYALYGTHAVLGPDALMYIGQANMNTFAGRLDWHFRDWGRWESSEVKVYLGRVGGWESITDEQWGRMVDQAESLTIFYTSPPYNSARIKTLRLHDPMIIVNHKRCHRIPRCISNLHDIFDIENPTFRLYGSDGQLPKPPPDAIQDEQSEISN